MKEGRRRRRRKREKKENMHNYRYAQHTCNPSIQESEAEGYKLRTGLGYIGRNQPVQHNEPDSEYIKKIIVSKQIVSDDSLSVFLAFNQITVHIIAHSRPWRVTLTTLCMQPHYTRSAFKLNPAPLHSLCPRKFIETMWKRLLCFLAFFCAWPYLSLESQAWAEVSFYQSLAAFASAILCPVFC